MKSYILTDAKGAEARIVLGDNEEPTEELLTARILNAIRTLQKK